VNDLDEPEEPPSHVSPPVACTIPSPQVPPLSVTF